MADGIDLLATLQESTGLPADTALLNTGQVIAVGHSAGGHLAAWAAGRSKLPPGAPGAPGANFVPLAGVIAYGLGVLALADCAREHVGGTAALDLMGGSPDELPEEYRLADPIAAVPVPAPVLLPALPRRRERALFLQRALRRPAARAAGGRAGLVELSGDHFTLIDPAAPDWGRGYRALPGLLGRANHPALEPGQITRRARAGSGPLHRSGKAERNGVEGAGRPSPPSRRCLSSAR